MLTVVWDASHLMLSVFLLSSGSNAQGKVECPLDLEAIQGSEAETNGVVRGTKGNIISPLTCPWGKPMTFLTKSEQNKISLVARPGWSFGKMVGFQLGSLFNMDFLLPTKWAEQIVLLYLGSHVKGSPSKVLGTQLIPWSWLPGLEFLTAKIQAKRCSGYKLAFGKV